MLSESVSIPGPRAKSAQSVIKSDNFLDSFCGDLGRPPLWHLHLFATSFISRSGKTK